MLRWTRRIVLSLLLLLALLALALWLGLRASLPQLDGEQRATGLGAPVELSRDERGYLSVQAATRADAARALGFAHAQDRFFQMDLLRRNAAGELAALVGEKAVPLDQKRRIHRFRWRAEQALAALPAPERALLQAYADGVNAGLGALSARPFEYALLRQPPAPWQAQDSLLCVLSMYLDLQREGSAAGELAAGVLKGALPPAWHAFLNQHSADWSAALDGSVPEPLPVPSEPWPLAASVKAACTDCGLADGRDIGSNNFAVGGALTAHGGALVANDMHLGIRVPNTWYKAQLRWRDEQGREHIVTGLSLPGMPAVVVGSNGRVAWGFTNSTADWSDVVALRKLDGDSRRYASPGGPKAFTLREERIEVAGAAAVEFEFRETEWGPVLPPPFENHALRWVAHDPEALNLRLLQLERVSSVDEALALAPGVGMPAQNLMVGDREGRIAWALIGAIPRRHYASGADMDSPQDWSTGAVRWDGYLAAGESWPQHKAAADDARLWSANARMMGGATLALLGNGGYDLGARGWQIREGLRAKTRFAEADLHAVQLDDRALLMARWRQLLLDEVLTPEFVAKHGLAEYRRAIETSAGAARADALGYTWVRAFRERLLENLFSAVAAKLEAQQLKLRDLKWVPETPAWALIQARRTDLLPAGQSWREAFERAVLESREAVLKKADGQGAEALTWGQQNRATFKHPLSAALPPMLADMLDLPSSPLAGDSHMPRVQRPVHGQSERMVVAPGHEASGILTVPGGQSGHPLSPFFRGDHAAWLNAEPLAFLPGPARHQLRLVP